MGAATTTCRRFDHRMRKRMRQQEQRMLKKSLEKQPKWQCYFCMFWSKAEECCVNPDVDSAQPDLGIGYNFKTNTCKSFKEVNQHDSGAKNV